jgi:hypothetical protein
MATKSSYSGLIQKTKVVEKAKVVSSTEFLKVVLGLDRRGDPFLEGPLEVTSANPFASEVEILRSCEAN